MPAPVLAISCDNLGEATRLRRGQWTPQTPLGLDPTVTDALPHLLDAFDAHRLRATFFVEAINAGLNPEAVREIAARGHEVAAHGWCHEAPADLDPARLDELLARSVRAFAQLGLRPAGYRPPGGELGPGTAAALAAHGFDWVSEAAGSAAACDEIRELRRAPFDWDCVDALHLMDSFAALRKRRGWPSAPASAAQAGARLREALFCGAGARVLVVHPTLMLDDAWSEQVVGLLDEIARRRDAGALRPVTCGEAAA